MVAIETPQRITSTDLVKRLMTEGLIGMSAAARRLGTFRDGKPTHPSTITRWCVVGVSLDDGTKLKLEHVRMGGRNGRLCTSEAALVRFIEAQQELHDGDQADNGPRSPSAYDRAAREAGEALERMGA
jgi:hypothetical protein